jgi:hypothetical protein
MDAEAVRRVAVITRPSTNVLSEPCLTFDDRHVIVRRVPPADPRVHAGANAEHHGVSSCAIETDESHTVDAVVFPDAHVPWRGSSAALHAACGEDAVDAVVHGVSTAIIVQGPPTTGKTSLIIGGAAVQDVDSPYHRGLLRRIVDDVLAALAPSSEVLDYSLSLGIVGIREDTAYDVLDAYNIDSSGSPSRAASPVPSSAGSSNSPRRSIHVRRIGTVSQLCDVRVVDIRTEDDIERALDFARPEVTSRGAHFLYFLNLVQTRCATPSSAGTRSYSETRSRVLVADLAADVGFDVVDADLPKSFLPRRPSGTRRPPTHLEQARVNVAVTTLRRVISGLNRRRTTLQTRGQEAPGEPIPLRDSLLTTVLVDYFGTRTRAAVVSVLSTATDPEHAAFALEDLQDAGEIINSVSFDQCEYHLKIRLLDDELMHMRRAVLEGWSTVTLALQSQLGACDETIMSWSERRQESQVKTHALQRYVLNVDYALHRQLLSNEAIAAARRIEAERRASVRREVDRVAEERMAEIAEKRRGLFRDIGIMCTLDGDDERADEEASRTAVAECSRIAELIRTSEVRRRGMQARTAASELSRREERGVVQVRDTLQSREAELQHKLQADAARTRHLNGLDDAFKRLTDHCEQIATQTIAEADDRDATVRRMTDEVSDLQTRLAAAQKALSETVVDVGAARADYAADIEHRRAALIDLNEALLKRRGVAEAKATEIAVYEDDLRSAEAAKARKQDRWDAAHDEWDQLRFREAELPDYVLGQMRIQVGYTQVEAAAAVDDLRREEAAVEDAEALLESARDLRDRLMEEIENAQHAVRELSLPDARKADFPQDPTLSALVMDVDFSTMLEDRDVRAVVSSRLFAEQQVAAATLKVGSVARSASAGRGQSSRSPSTSSYHKAVSPVS